MFFSKFFALSAMTTFAVAAVAVKRSDDGDSEGCPAATALECCQTVATATDPAVSAILGLLGITLSDTNVK
ncbi:hypothetical protein V5O48_006443, partial [Marasmius crinis-equi]